MERDIIATSSLYSSIGRPPFANYVLLPFWSTILLLFPLFSTMVFHKLPCDASFFFLVWGEVGRDELLSAELLVAHNFL